MRPPRQDKNNREKSRVDPERIRAILAQALTAFQNGRLTQAQDLCRQVVKLHPQGFEAVYLLGLIADQKKDFDRAVEYLGRAIELNPHHIGAITSRAIVLRWQGKLESAIADFDAAVALKEDLPEAHFNRATALRELGRHAEAVAGFDKVIGFKPDFAPAYNNRGNALMELGLYQAAIASFDRAIALRPDYSEAHYNRGNVLLRLLKYDDALASFERAIALKVEFAEAYNSRGVVLRELGRLEEAEADHRRALTSKPDFAEAKIGLAHIFREIGRYDDALAYQKRALADKPDLAEGYKNLLATLTYHPSLDQDEVFAIHRQFEDRYAKPLYRHIEPHRNDPDPARRLRIGYMSSDFRTHPVAQNLLPIIGSHNREQFEVFFYAEVAQPDSVTAVFRSLADGWRSTVGLSDSNVAAMIRDDRIDVLVCLAGRFDQNRLLVSAFKPAPIQISFHDVATSGLSVMDYLISDRVMTPRNGKEHFTERLLCLPKFYLSTMPPDLPPIKPRSGPTVFGCLNNPSKIADPVLELWARLLGRVSDSRLLLRYRKRYDPGLIRERVYAVFDSHGLDRERVFFPAEAQTSVQHLDTYNEIDIALDTFPFTGSTTTFEALIMGVPVVTLPGATMVSRWTAGMLHSVGMSDLIAHSPEDYLDIAQKLSEATDRRRLWRMSLRDCVANSSLCDNVGRTRHVERFYRAVWRRWCASAVQNKR